MKHNILYFTQRIPIDVNEDDISTYLYTVVNEMQKIYSYVIYVNKTEFVIRYALSEYDRYNTFSKNEVVGCVLDDIEHYREYGGKYIIGFRQPDISILVEVLEPLVNKLATKQHERWKMLEYEDLCQICRMTMVILYNKNYFIHKRLLERSFENAVLQEVKKVMNEYEIISLESKVVDDDDSNRILLIDTIKDVEQEIAVLDKEVAESNQSIFEEVRDIIIDIIGQRQFEQLYRDYTKGHTTTWSRRKMQTLKAIFEREDLTKQKFNNKYGVK